MQLQVLFSRRELETLVIDGVLHAAGEPGQPVTIVGARPGNGMLSLIIPATLDSWADELTVVDVRDTGRSLELRHGDTRVTIEPVDARA